MEQNKTPGVYVVEQDAFPNSVVEVPTAVPAFIGYTQTAQRGATDMTNKPTRISSMAEYQGLFGDGPTLFVSQGDDAKLKATQRYLMFLSMQLFFNNGGGPCWIVSVGGYSYDTKDSKYAISKDALLAGIETLKKTTEVTKLVIPDAVSLNEQAEWADVANAMLAQSETLKDRIAILDIFRGNEAATPGGFDPIASFRSSVTADELSYGVAYYPWVHTNLIEPSAIDFTVLDASARTALADAITDEQTALKKPEPVPQQITELIADLTASKPAKDTRESHTELATISPIYSDTMARALEAVNLMPPSSGMAGVIARTDGSVGVWKAPANTSFVSVTAPSVPISNDEQQDLNVPLDGKAINAIRSFAGRGVLVWGARTLDGNSQDWRYVSVRRTLIMLEQSIKFACEAYVFSPNDAGTWVTVRSMIDNFLNNQWKAGALAGSTPQEAYQVDVGLGSTMTGNDILDGYMRVTVKVAVTRPAEFIILTFQQKMQTS